MKKLHKILLFLISLLGLVLSTSILSLFYAIPYVTETIKVYQALYPWLNNVFSGFCALIFLFFVLIILVALFSPIKSNDLILVKDKGRLFFSKQTIESTIRYSFADESGINSTKVRVKTNKIPEKTKIYVKLSLNDSTRLVELTQTIQDKIESTLKLSLGITVEFINIKVVEFNTDQRVQKEKHIDEAKDSRVI